MPATVMKQARLKRRASLLKAPGWTAQTRAALEKLITVGAGKRLPAVFDFDNTIVRGDIGEATLAMLVRSGVLSAVSVPPGSCPPFEVPGRGRVSPETCTDLTQYYDALLAPTAHGDKDPTPLATGYAWAVEAMAGLRLADVVEATRKAFHWRDPAMPGFIQVTPGKTAYPVPVFHPEMVELLAQLLRHEFDVWIFSASNVWSVRWMILNALNPMLRKQGASKPLRPQNVVGVSVLLKDNRGRFYKDSVLVQQDKQYSTLQQSILQRFRLSSHLHFPVPTYSGKIAALFDLLGREPYLGAGDSPGDLPMLSLSQNRLWIARLEKPWYQKAALEICHKIGRGAWLVQPSLPGNTGGLVANPGSLRLPVSQAAPAICQSLGLLSNWPVKTT